MRMARVGARISEVIFIYSRCIRVPAASGFRMTGGRILAARSDMPTRLTARTTHGFALGMCPESPHATTTAPVKRDTRPPCCLQPRRWRRLAAGAATSPRANARTLNASNFASRMENPGEEFVARCFYKCVCRNGNSTKRQRCRSIFSR